MSGAHQASQGAARLDLDALKARVPMSRLASYLALTGPRTPVGQMDCPACGGGAYLNAGDQGFRCGDCGASGTVIDALMAVDRGGFRAAVARLKTLADQFDAKDAAAAAGQRSLL